MTIITVKCRKCRHLLFLHPEITLFTAHEESCTNLSVKYISCQTIQEDNVWFLQDNNLPDWISEVVNKSNWTKGKVNCPNCQGRLGSFDFVSGTKCQCGSHVLPPVHIVKSWTVKYDELICPHSDGKYHMWADYEKVVIKLEDSSSKGFTM